MDSIRDRWDDLWTHVVRSAAAALADGHADVLDVRRRLEDVCELYRRCLCDPVQMYSLPLQSLVSNHLAEHERLRMDAAPNRDDTDDAPMGTEESEPWRRLVAAPLAVARVLLEDWGPRDLHHPRWQWRLPFSLYAGGQTTAHLPNTYHRCPDTWFRASHTLLAVARVCDGLRMCLAAAAETMRLFLQSDADAAAGADMTIEEWSCLDQGVHARDLGPPPGLKTELIAKVGAFCDVEGVAVSQCGWPLRCQSPTTTFVEWWEPLADAEEVLRRRIRGHPHGPVIEEVLRAWARLHRLEAYVGLRYPPAFVAVVAEAFADALGNHPLRVASIPWDLSVIARAQVRSATPMVHEMWSNWALLGVLVPPDEATLTRGWDSHQRLRFESDGSRLSARLWDDLSKSRQPERGIHSP